MSLPQQTGWKAEGVVTVKNFDDAIFLAKEMDVKEMMVIGGGEIYSSVFDKANRIHITRVDAEFEGRYFLSCILILKSGNW